jgi:hypothetical protein
LFLVSFSATPCPRAGEKGERELEEAAIGDDLEESIPCKSYGSKHALGPWTRAAYLLNRSRNLLNNYRDYMEDSVLKALRYSLILKPIYRR